MSFWARFNQCLKLVSIEESEALHSREKKKVKPYREGLSNGRKVVEVVCPNQSVVNRNLQGSKGVYSQIIREIKATSVDLVQVDSVHEYMTSNVDAHRI